MIRALRHKNLRYYLIGQTVSLTGTWMQQLAMSWLVYRLTQSAFWLGAVNFFTQIPMFLFSLFAGVLVERMNLLKLLIYTQIFAAIQAFILAALILTGKINLEEIIFLSIWLGTVNAIDTPARQSFMIQMIGDQKEDLHNAIAMGSSVMNLTRLLGPAIAGMLIVKVGEGGCVLINAVSYLAVLIALAQIRVKERPRVLSTVSIRASLMEGFAYSLGEKRIASLLLLLSALSLLGTPFMTMLPLIADQKFQGGAETLAHLTTLTGVGAFVAAIVLGLTQNPKALPWRIGGVALGFSVGLGFLAISHNFTFTLVLLLLCGFGMMFQMAGSNIAIQTAVHDDKRGRVMGLFTLSVLGIPPFGNLLVGGLAEKWGVQNALLICACLYGGVSLAFFRKIRKNSLNPS